MSRTLCAIFFLSGTAALLFETLWFRQAGITFGNSVWASSLVLSSYMGGLALGNTLAARFGSRVRNPIAAYAALESMIAVVGLSLVLILPALPALFVPLFRPLLELPWVLNPLRFTSAFALLLIPTTAMGATLPLLTKALGASDANFGRVLGRLYGWNTLGAVVGAIAGEAALIGWLGLRGTGFVAAGGAGLAACAATALSRSEAAKLAFGPRAFSAVGAGRRTPASPVPLSSCRCLAAVFLSGALLLALEAVWFRFLQLFVFGTSLAFAVMLAVVLAGIGIGGLLGASLLHRRAAAYRLLPVLALASGAFVLVPYALFEGMLNLVFDGAADAHLRAYTREPLQIALLGLALMGPTSLLSGMMFPWLGQVAKQVYGSETRSAGYLTLANTLGGMLGVLVGGFGLLPWLGVERSFLVVAACYGVVAALVWPLVNANTRAAGVSTPIASRVAGGLFVVSFLLFPTGKMLETYILNPSRPYIDQAGMKVVATRESQVGTLVYLRQDFLGEPIQYRLVMDGVGMAGTHWIARRYMKLFVNLPVAIHPAIEKALLISYGLGSTASAMIDTPSIEHIDVVDISRDIIELSEIVYPMPGSNPIDDPRVEVHIEDGRFFLLSTDERYDLITGEPPPPHAAGIVNLYSREYFQLIYDRLADGGIATYWLPVDLTGEPGGQAVIRAFCEVFYDCTLWAGTTWDWMLMGTRNRSTRVTAEHFGAQWRIPEVASELSTLGFERPAQLGALFLGGADFLHEYTKGVSPLVDDHPERLPSGSVPTAEIAGVVERMVDPRATRPRIEGSEFLHRAFPPDVIRQALHLLDYQDFINHTPQMLFTRPPESLRNDLVRVLRETSLRSPVLWYFGADDDRQRILLARSEPALDPGAREFFRAVGALARRNYMEAATEFEQAQRAAPEESDLKTMRVLSLCLAGRVDLLPAGAGKPSCSDILGSDAGS